MNPFPVFYIVGPTCTGKTALSIYLSSKVDGKVINADNLQFYKYMDIGSAKPNLLDPQRHFLFSHVKPPSIYTAGQFNKEASSLLEKFSGQNICFVVGGSGFYLNALEKGCYPIQKLSLKMREQLTEEVKIKGLSVLYQELKNKDPLYSNKIHPRDSYRIIRALSVIRVENKKMSDIQKDFKPKKLPYRVIKIGLIASSSVLKKRIQMRTQNMMAQGLLKEVEFLYKKVGENFPPLQSVGYKEALQVLKGILPKDKLVDQINQRTYQLVKKQKKWFKRDASIQWFDCEADFQDIYSSYVSELKS